MMRQYELVERVLAYNPNADEALLNKAYVYAMQKHGSQTRASGDPYFAHPLEVAAILTELKLDDATIAVALLHDTIEDTDATRAEIDEMFGTEIGQIVDGLTKIDRLNLVSREEAQAENLRKLLLAISQDVRVLLVKLADRLHNMRTLDFMPVHKRGRIAQETMDIYAPLAGRMGMQDMRNELEDLSFKTLHPEHYNAIMSRLAQMQTSSREIIAEISTELEEHLAQQGITAAVSSRMKSAWSIYSKIERQGIALEQLSDMIGFRVIVDTVDQCYRTLGVIHTSWKVVPGRFKDYISVPKHNDYRSIHTTIVGPGRQRVELQIRTMEMHAIAEFGIAAHQLYKEAISGDMHRLEEESRAYNWLRTTIARLTEGDNPEEFVEHTKLELFQDQVFCFTPRGRLIPLPRGATPIDFAYAVHTDVGDTCVGCKINGTVMPLITQLHSGDEVEIIRDATHTPPPNWENIAVTGKARSAIRRAVRQGALQRAVTLGEQVMMAVIEREALDMNEDELDLLAERLEMEDRNAMLAAIGEGTITAEELAEQMTALKGKPRRKGRLSLPVANDAEGWFSLRNAQFFKFRMPGGQRASIKKFAAMVGFDFNMPVTVSPEGVVPGDRIIGIFHQSGVMEVYPMESDALVDFHDEDVGWIDVRWDMQGRTEELFRVVISMYSQNRPGSLAQITSAIAACDANISNLVMRALAADSHELLFELEVRDLTQLTDVLATLKRSPGLSRVQRATLAQARAVSGIDGALDATTHEHKETQPA
ncbi:MAG TPA: bifunctional (p)ppGpp synthetase/guanosine-3',5'-bis(diphosphate) 3'-pyrophosphohydrolase [Pelagibacterium sp.]|uniref:RelA/SpoT family protein n=1 Tax=Pelagibacterium sp. TaxID=1967288 RepID=UPI002C56BF12|nr:bifunctional (p)ppGpp synthetase/guanosine-3',5'-bis(diphosphate) 3'-pyrophosphohydrolase [Pelagibacterium sp.]HWJ87383.1 bifunctional (p)ppGpp synthetase/guanosine-3',5'-bis(diphosphate) 3'-pyrophosphohydrolase [Pelagibacterium sp.]